MSLRPDMRALRYHSFGQPADVLRLDDLPVPSPGPGEALVRLTHRTINPADLLKIRARYALLPSLPATGGKEGVGIVERVGAGVTGLKIGQRVVSLGGGPTWQEFLSAPAQRLLPVPPSVSDEAAAQLYVNPLTAWLLLDALPDARPGDALVLTAGASAVARCAMQLGRRRGLRTVALVRGDTHADALRALGAEVLVASTNDETTRAQLRALVGPEGAVGVFDALAGDAGALALSALRPGGSHLVYGGLSGRPLPVGIGSLIFRDIQVRGIWLTRWAERVAAETVAQAAGELVALLPSGELTLPAEASYDLSDFHAALEHVERPGRGGKVLLTG